MTSLLPPLLETGARTRSAGRWLLNPQSRQSRFEIVRASSCPSPPWMLWRCMSGPPAGACQRSPDPCCIQWIVSCGSFHLSGWSQLLPAATARGDPSGTAAGAPAPRTPSVVSTTIRAAAARGAGRGSVLRPSFRAMSGRCCQHRVRRASLAGAVGRGATAWSNTPSCSSLPPATTLLYAQIAILRSPNQRSSSQKDADLQVFHGRYWARTSDLRLVEAALSQLS